MAFLPITVEDPDVDRAIDWLLNEKYQNTEHFKTLEFYTVEAPECPISIFDLLYLKSTASSVFQCAGIDYGCHLDFDRADVEGFTNAFTSLFLKHIDQFELVKSIELERNN